MTIQQAIATLREHLAGVDLPPNERKMVQEAFDVLRQPPGMRDAWAFKAGKRAMQKEVMGVIEEMIADLKGYQSQFLEPNHEYISGFEDLANQIKTRIQQLGKEEVSQ